MTSPYENKPVEEWSSITDQIVEAHPLETKVIVEVVLDAWDRILSTKIGDKLQIGVDIFPSPQILGSYLHMLIPVLLCERESEKWGCGIEKSDKDIIYIPDDRFSIEIKTSSAKDAIYGNRSYGQENSKNSSGKKKFGYYLAINFEKFSTNEADFEPIIKQIKFGWLDHTDWKAQIAATGQNATLVRNAWLYKMKLLYVMPPTEF